VTGTEDFVTGRGQSHTILIGCDLIQSVDFYLCGHLQCTGFGRRMAIVMCAQEDNLGKEKSCKYRNDRDRCDIFVK
jgi:hypothetical protein